MDLRLLTAGHCFDVDKNIINERCTTDGCVGSKADMGKVTHNGLGDNRCNDTCDKFLDSAVFTGCTTSDTSDNNHCGGSDLIFTGDLGDPQIATVAGKTSWHVLDRVCESGAYHGERCGFEVQDGGINYCTWFPPGAPHEVQWYYCHLTETFSSNVHAADGDSGAPVFRFEGSSLYAVGTLTGGTEGAPGGDYMWFTGINASLDKWNATLHTG